MPQVSTSLGLLPMRTAAGSDLATLIALLREAQAWMDQHRLGQWVPGAHDPSRIEAMIHRREVYVVERDAQVIAVFALTSELPGHWPPHPDPFGYLSTLTVARDFAAQGIGAALIAWAEALLRDQRKRWSCLDCYGKNPRLRAYYERLGYVALGEVETYPGYPERMFRKRLT